MFLRPVLFFAVVVAANIVSQLTDACEFPRSFQSNVTSRAGGVVSREWRGRIKQQYAEFTLRVAIGKNMMKIISSETSGSNSGAQSHTRVCVRSVPGGKFIVAHEEAGQSGNKFTCIQFIMRSADVFQIRSAPLSDKLDLGLCNDNLLQLDKWLIIDHAHIGRDPQACPLQGGYLLGLYDKIRSQGVCDAWRGEIRLESECSPGDGIVFFFRTQKCVPEDLMMFSTQPVFCLATWLEGPYVYSVLRHHTHSYFWVLRLPASATTWGQEASTGSSSESTSRGRGGIEGAGFTAYLYKDLLAESVEYSSESYNYIRMDMTRDVTTDDTRLCSDDYEICTAQLQAPCADRQSSLALTCPVTCGVCSASSHRMCSLPPAWAGQWADGGSPAGVGVGGRRRSVTIDDRTITIHSRGLGRDERNITYQCVNWESARQNDDQMLVRIFDRGCRPRYTCAKALRQSSFLLYMKLSLPTMWPLTKSRSDPIDCDSFTYDQPHYGSSAAAKDRSISDTAARSFLLTSSISSRNSRQNVECNLPSETYLNYMVALRDVRSSGVSGVGGWSGMGGRAIETDCGATLSTIEKTRTVLTLFGSGCSPLLQTLSINNVTEDDVWTSTFSCIDSSIVNNTSGGDTLIIVESLASHSGVTQRDSKQHTVHEAAVLYCWLFPKSPPAASMFYLLNGTECHQVTQANARLDQLHQYSALFRASKSARTRASTRKLPDRSTISVTSLPPSVSVTSPMHSLASSTSRTVMTSPTRTVATVGSSTPQQFSAPRSSLQGQVNFVEAERRQSTAINNVITSTTTIFPRTFSRMRFTSKPSTLLSSPPPQSSLDVRPVRGEEFEYSENGRGAVTGWASHFFVASTIVPIMVILVFFLCRCVS